MALPIGGGRFGPAAIRRRQHAEESHVMTRTATSKPVAHATPTLAEQMLAIAAQLSPEDKRVVAEAMGAKLPKSAEAPSIKGIRIIRPGEEFGGSKNTAPSVAVNTLVELDSNFRMARLQPDQMRALLAAGPSILAALAKASV
jgi:hypothetical protein